MGVKIITQEEAKLDNLLDNIVDYVFLHFVSVQVEGTTISEIIDRVKRHSEGNQWVVTRTSLYGEDTCVQRALMSLSPTESWDTRSELILQLSWNAVSNYVTIIS